MTATATSSETVGSTYAPRAAGGAPAPGPLGSERPVLLIPSLGRRVAWAVVRAALLLIVIVVVPWYLLSRLSAYGIGTPVPILGLALLGGLFAGLGAVRYISRPTRAFGPMTIAASMVSIVYLLYLIPIASIGFSHADNVSVAIDFGRFLQYCLIVPVFGLASGSVTTYEDFARPRERINYEYSL
jgi:hypothetical protein